MQQSCLAMILLITNKYMFKLLNQFLSFIIWVVEVLLSFRFILKLLAAREAAAVVSWIYLMTEPLLKPFLFAFPTPSVKGGFQLEFTTLFALFAYGFVGYMLQELLMMIDENKKK